MGIIRCFEEWKWKYNSHENYDFSAIVEYPDHTEINISKLFNEIIHNKNAEEGLPDSSSILGTTDYMSMDHWYNNRKEKFEEMLKKLLEDKVVTFISTEYRKPQITFIHTGLVTKVDITTVDGQLYLVLKQRPDHNTMSSDDDITGIPVDMKTNIKILKKGADVAFFKASKFDM